jgi:dolichyl-phosphate beta-glucosyltransferase
LSGEIIVVDDGSSDDTAEVARSTSTPAAVDLKVIRHKSHHGKGYAVRSGMAVTGGDYVMFADAGLCIPYDAVLTGLELIRSGACDMAYASRRLPESRIVRPQNWQRRLSSHLFRSLARIVLHIPSVLTDTQCGFKIYRAEVALQLYGRCVTDGFLFDIEIILRAVKAGYRIAEFPVTWTCDPDSRLAVGRTIGPVLAEMRRIKCTLASENDEPDAPHQ